MAVCQNLVPLVNIKIAGKWMFIPLKMVLIGIDPYPYKYIPGCKWDKGLNPLPTGFFFTCQQWVFRHLSPGPEFLPTLAM